MQLGSPVDLDTCTPDFSSRTVLIRVESPVDAIRAPLSVDLSSTPEGDVDVCRGADPCVSTESATLQLDRFAVGDGAGGTLTMVEEDGTGSTIEFDAVWCDHAAGPPACD